MDLELTAHRAYMGGVHSMGETPPVVRQRMEMDLEYAHDEREGLLGHAKHVLEWPSMTVILG